MKEATSRGPMSGIVVIDLTHVWSGPVATKVFAALGADVIRFESFSHTDHLRGSGETDLSLRYPNFTKGEDPYNRNAWFNTQNVGKRSAVIDLKTREGLRLGHEMVCRADVVIGNRKPGVLDRLGMGYERLRELNERIVVAEMPAYWPGSAREKAPAFGVQFEALSGGAWLNGNESEPVLTGFALGDPTAGLFAAAAVLTALYRRDIDGVGAHIVLAQTEGMLPLLGEFICAHSRGEPVLDPINDDPRELANGIFAAGDGRWVALTITTAGELRALHEVLSSGAPVGESSRAGDWIDGDREVVRTEIARLMRCVDNSAVLVARLQGVGVAAGLVQGAEDLITDTQLEHSGFFELLEHPSVGKHRYPGLPLTIDNQRMLSGLPAPRLGEHTMEVLREHLRYQDTDLERLAADRVIVDTRRADGDR